MAVIPFRLTQSPLAPSNGVGSNRADGALALFYVFILRPPEKLFLKLGLLFGHAVQVESHRGGSLKAHPVPRRWPPAIARSLLQAEAPEHLF